MSEKVEQVARAMMAEDALGATADGPGIHRKGWRAYEPMARAAIEAMREPTEAMLRAGQEQEHECLLFSLEPGEGLDEFDPEPAWRAMIDEALKD